jgi:DNA-nicking Smr family endonuclease
MNFGEILDEWEKGAEERRRAVPQQSSRKLPDPPPDGGRARSVASEAMIAHLNRNGTEDKDAELDAAAEKERLESTAGLASQRIDARLDLHGLTAAEAERRLLIFLEDSRRRGCAKVLIIHGKGNHSEEGGVLGRVVREALDRCGFAGRRGAPERRLGGSGALWVILKPPRPPR